MSFINYLKLLGQKTQFEKWAVLLKNELSFEMGRIYGIAYQASIPHSQIKVKFQKKQEREVSF